MCSSPGTPIGSSRIAASSTYSRVFAIGTPIGTTAGGVGLGGHAHQLTSTAHSVGPYRLCNGARGTARYHAATRSGASASPLAITARNDAQREKLTAAPLAAAPLAACVLAAELLAAAPLAVDLFAAAPLGEAPLASSAPTNARSIEGTKWHTVTPARSMSSARYAGSLCPPGRASTSFAPVSSGQKNSHTLTSKLIGVFCSTTSCPVSPNACCIHASRFTIPRCALSAPFGRPVEPDV